MLTKKLSNDEITKLIKENEQFLQDVPTDYMLAFIKKDKVTISIYNSGKAVFQGGEYEKNNEKDSVVESHYFDFYTVIGSDEVGTGDFFGPIVVSTILLKAIDSEYLLSLGVKDSKKLTDTKIMTIAPLIIKRLKTYISILHNKKYNEVVKDNNLNQIKAKMHNFNFLNAVKTNKYDYVILDKFCSEKKYFSYLDENCFKDITFLEKAESKSLSVAAASIVARYYFLEELAKASKSVGVDLPKGAGTKVIELARVLIDKDYPLNEIAKLNFKTYTDLKDEKKES